MNHSTRFALLTYGAVLIASISWGAVFWVGWKVWNAEDFIALEASTVAQATAREASLVRLRALVRETREGREELHRRADIDVVHAVEVIERAGKESGVTLDVSGAGAEEAEGEGVSRSIVLVVKARGTFTALARALLSLDTLPIPSGLMQFQIEKTPGAVGDWILTARVRVVVSSALTP